jgi:hypothetical protein
LDGKDNGKKEFSVRSFVLSSMTDVTRWSHALVEKCFALSSQMSLPSLFDCHHELLLAWRSEEAHSFQTISWFPWSFESVLKCSWNIASRIVHRGTSDLSSGECQQRSLPHIYILSCTDCDPSDIHGINSVIHARCLESLMILWKFWLISQPCVRWFCWTFDFWNVSSTITRHKNLNRMFVSSFDQFKYNRPEIPAVIRGAGFGARETI